MLLLFKLRLFRVKRLESSHLSEHFRIVLLESGAFNPSRIKNKDYKKEKSGDVEEFPDPYSKKYKKYVYQITVQGSYHQIASFVSLLESYKQYFQIQMLGIVPQLKTPGKHISDIKLMAVSHNVTEAKA